MDNSESPSNDTTIWPTNNPASNTADDATPLPTNDTLLLQNMMFIRKHFIFMEHCDVQIMIK